MPYQLVVVVLARGPRSRNQHSLRVPNSRYRSWVLASSSPDLHKWSRRRGVPLLRSSLAFECGKPLTSSLSTHLVPFPTRHPRGFVPTVPSLATWHLPTTVVVGHQLRRTKPRAKGLGAETSHRHWGGPRTSMINIDPGLLAAREVSKGRRDGAPTACRYSRPPTRTNAGCRAHTHANAVGPWCCRSSTAAARNITRLTGLCDDRVGGLMLGKEERRSTYPVNINGWR